MAKSPAFQFYASDFLTDTQSWGVEEVGIYIRLLANQWVNKGLPNDKKRLARIAGCDDKMFKKAWVILGFKFSVETDGFLRNPKMEEIRKGQIKFSEKQKNNGLKGGRPRKGVNQTKPKQNPNNNPNDNPNKSSSSSILSKDNIYKIPPTHPFFRLPNGDSRRVLYETGTDDYRRKIDFEIQCPL